MSTSNSHATPGSETFCEARTGCYGFVTDANDWTPLLALSVCAALAGSLSIGLGAAGSAGLMTLPAFLARFFPALAEGYHGAQGSASDPWCAYHDRTLQLFQSLPNLAAVPAALAASAASRALGRRPPLLASAAVYLLAVALGACAGSRAVLLAGRAVLGLAIGGILQSAPLLLSEMAPAARRGALGSWFASGLGLGMMLGAAANFGIGKLSAAWSWRLAFAVEAPPGILLLAAAWVLPDSPNSLVERSRPREALAVLQRLRGPEADVAEEYADIQRASAQAAALPALRGWRRLLGARRYRPALAITLLVPVAANLSGNVQAELAPVLLRTMGASSDVALLVGVLTAACYAGSALAAARAMDRAGRKPMLYAGGSAMVCAQAALAGLVGWAFGKYGAEGLPAWAIALSTVFVCCTVLGFGMSWGSLSNLVPCEVLPLRVRPPGQALNAALNAGTMFMAEFFYLSLLCALEFGVWLVFAGCGVLGMLGIALLLPDTKGQPLERVEQLFREHRVWGKVLRNTDGSGEDGSVHAERSAHSSQPVPPGTQPVQVVVQLAGPPGRAKLVC